jgi:hypothetical protein
MSGVVRVGRTVRLVWQRAGRSGRSGSFGVVVPIVIVVVGRARLFGGLVGE